MRIHAILHHVLVATHPSACTPFKLFPPGNRATDNNSRNLPRINSYASVHSNILKVS